MAKVVIAKGERVAVTFHSQILVGELTGYPFENRLEDIPLTALSRAIEINLREVLEEDELPSKVQAVDGYLW
ncbi:MAG: hypothetical protein AAF242_06735 [Bacteroidota bacterium]